MGVRVGGREGGRAGTFGWGWPGQGWWGDGWGRQHFWGIVCQLGIKMVLFGNALGAAFGILGSSWLLGEGHWEEKGVRRSRGL